MNPQSPLSVNGNIYFYWNYSGRLVYNDTFESFIWLITWNNCRFSCWKVFNSNGSYMSPFINKCAGHFCKRPQSKIIDPNQTKLFRVPLWIAHWHISGSLEITLRVSLSSVDKRKIQFIFMMNILQFWLKKYKNSEDSFA